MTSEESAANVHQEMAETHDRAADLHEESAHLHEEHATEMERAGGGRAEIGLLRLRVASERPRRGSVRWPTSSVTRPGKGRRAWRSGRSHREAATTVAHAFEVFARRRALCR